MKRNLILLFALSWAAASARADLLITLDTPAQTGAPGDTLVFKGILANTGAGTVFLNSADLNLAGTSFTTTFFDLFFSNVPASLGAGQSTLDIELFDVTLNNPFTDGPGIYSGTYDVVGGADGTAQDLLASASFAVTAVPESSAALFLASALIAIMVTRSGVGTRERVFAFGVANRLLEQLREARGVPLQINDSKNGAVDTRIRAGHPHADKAYE